MSHRNEKICLVSWKESLISSLVSANLYETYPHGQQDSRTAGIDPTTIAIAFRLLSCCVCLGCLVGISRLMMVDLNEIVRNCGKGLGYVSISR